MKGRIVVSSRSTNGTLGIAVMVMTDDGDMIEIPEVAALDMDTDNSGASRLNLTFTSGMFDLDISLRNGRPHPPSALDQAMRPKKTRGAQ